MKDFFYYQRSFQTEPSYALNVLVPLSKYISPAVAVAGWLLGAKFKTELKVTFAPLSCIEEVADIAVVDAHFGTYPTTPVDAA